MHGVRIVLAGHGPPEGRRSGGIGLAAQVGEGVAAVALEPLRQFAEDRPALQRGRHAQVGHAERPRLARRRGGAAVHEARVRQDDLARHRVVPAGAPERQRRLGGGDDGDLQGLEQPPVRRQVPAAPGTVGADAAGGAVRRRGRAVLHVVAQQVIARAQAREVMQPEEAPGHAEAAEQGRRLVGIVAQQAVDREAAPPPAAPARPAQGLRHRGGGIDAQPPAVQQHAERPRLACRPHHRPGLGRMQVQVVHAERGEAGALAPQAELHAADARGRVVVAEGHVQVGEPGAGVGDRPREGLGGPGPRRGGRPDRRLQPGFHRGLAGDDVVAEPELVTADPALGAAGGQVVGEGVHLGLGDVRIELEVVAHREAGAGIAPLAPAGDQEVVQRVGPRRGDVGVVGQVPLGVELRLDDGAVGGGVEHRPRTRLRRRGEQRLQAPRRRGPERPRQPRLGVSGGADLAPFRSAPREEMEEGLGARPGHVGMGLQIGLGGEPGRRVAPLAPAGEHVVLQRVLGGIGQIGIDRPVEGRVERRGDNPVDFVNLGRDGHRAQVPEAAAAGWCATEGRADQPPPELAASAGRP
ncbi:conserved hypothetical protein [Phenylobacterium zucineum HLK1]|uniref:Uncharacterized protein n=1 Tax=Phenylobacterium zucineum (strain HLK1) TaxID=450851 RepID=B4REF5_PHEZH|nr:conserved hypothetical protein [Phenylobacterium zucineum HLK1]